MAKGSIVDLTTKLRTQLLSFGGLVTGLEQKDVNFLPDLVAWLKSTEDILNAHNVAEASELGGYRSKLIVPKLMEGQKTSLRRAQLRIAAEMMFDVQTSVQVIYKPHQSTIEEAQQLARQLLSVALQADVIHYDEERGFQGLVNELWTLFTTHPQLKPIFARMRVLVLEPDALRIIADEIVLSDWKDT